MLSVGSRVGAYVVEAVVGRGGMATVYRVRDVEGGGVCALKVIEMAGLQPRERFAREARAQSLLQHPNIVAVTGFVDVDGLPGFLMELVEGLPLDRLLARETLDWRMVDRLYADILAGVEAAHALRMVHRDLKPSNVLVGNLGGIRVAKVADFGIVKLMASGGDPTLTQSNATMGTPGYMAPEQVSNAKHVDERADIFGLGCVLYRMVCGRPPFVGDARAIFNAASGGHYDHPRTRRPDLPERYVNAITACLHPEREDRPPSVAALRELVFADMGAGVATPVPAPSRADPSTWPPAPERVSLDTLAAALGEQAAGRSAEPAPLPTLAPPPPPGATLVVPAAAQAPPPALPPKRDWGRVVGIAGAFALLGAAAVALAFWAG